MKLSSIENKAALSPTTAERKTAGSAGKASAAEASAKVELSTAALTGAEASAQVFDAAKVQRISDAIRSGQFKINAEAIADKLIANAEELLGPANKS